MYRCNETGREFEEPRYDPDFWNKGDGAKVCPCCGDTDYDEVFECDICCAHVTWDDGHVGSKYGNSCVLPAGRSPSSTCLKKALRSWATRKKLGWTTYWTAAAGRI